MKKIYLLLGAISFGMAASAQSQLGPTKKQSLLRSGATYPHANESRTNVQAADRGPALWTDNFSTLSNWNATNNPLHTAGSTNPGWEIVTSIPATLTGQGYDATFNSTSGGEFAFIDSDAAGGSATQDADITWAGAPIDLTGAANNFISFQFENYHRIFLETHTVSVSVDGGTTWTDFLVNEIYGSDVGNYQPLPGSNNPEVVSVAMGSVFDPFVTGGGTLNNVSIKFNYQGQWDWFWCVDDVAFVPTPDDEGELLTGRFGAATPDPIWADNLQYFTISDDQIDPAGYIFWGTAVNAGANAQANGRIDATVTPGMGAPTNLTSQHTLANWAAGDTLKDTTNAFTPTTTPDTYSTDFALTYDNDASDNDPTNNDLSIDDFQVTMSRYGRTPDNMVGGTFNGDDGAGSFNAYIIGTMVTAYTAQDIEALNVAFWSTSDAGAIIYPYIIEMDPAAASFQDLFINVLYDGSQIANGEYTLQAADIPAAGSTVWTQINLQTPVSMTAGNAYFIGFGFYGGPEACIIGTNNDHPSPDATNFIYDATDENGAGAPQWYWFGTNPMIQAVFDVGLGVEESEELGIALGQNVPNPANNTTAIEYTIVQGGDVTLDVVDVTGKTVMTVNEGNRAAGTYRMTLDTDELSGGVYFYTLTANGKRMTKRMVIEK